MQVACVAPVQETEQPAQPLVAPPCTKLVPAGRGAATELARRRRRGALLRWKPGQ